MTDQEPQGTFTCDVCGSDRPHHHSPKEVEQERFIRPAFETYYAYHTVDSDNHGQAIKPWRQIGPTSTYRDVRTQMAWFNFVQGWFAAKTHTGPASPAVVREEEKTLGRLLDDLITEVNSTGERLARSLRITTTKVAIHTHVAATIKAMVKRERERCRYIAERADNDGCGTTIAALIENVADDPAGDVIWSRTPSRSENDSPTTTDA